MAHNHIHSRRSRRRGVSLMLFVVSLPVIIGVTGLVIDMGNLYTRRSIAQRAADAAALAGSQVANNDALNYNTAEINAAALDYAKRNGYSASEVTVDPKVDSELGKVRVTVARRESVFFTPALEALLGSNPVYNSRVVGTATAEKIVKVELSPSGNYGTTDGASNPSAFGPQALHSYGDPYSAKYYDDGTLNDAAHISNNKGTGWDQTSHYDPNGFMYSMTVPSSLSTVRVQLYDPDGYISSTGLDELHNDYAGPNAPIHPEATTKYTIYKVMADGSLQQVSTVTYGADQSVDADYLKSQGQDPWITPAGFKFSTATYGPGAYKIQVQTIDGSSENGYNLRAGPDYSGTLSETDWNNLYGDKGGTDPSNIVVPVLSDDKIQMNFTRTSSNVKVRLGYLPAGAAGKDLTVSKFDTDVGSSSIKYSYIEDGTTTPVYTSDNNYLNPANDTWSQDTVAVPPGFKGGYWFAEYAAGQADTSSWSISYAGGGPGAVHLVQ